jgi:Tol biopolymer transport system component
MRHVLHEYSTVNCYPSRIVFCGCAILSALGCTEEATSPLPVPAALVVVAGDQQVRFAHTSLVDNVTVGLVDNEGDPAEVGGVSVTWSVTAGGGSVTVDHDTTDIVGRARARWTLGDLGDQGLEARSSGLGTVTLGARAVTPGAIVFVSNRRTNDPGDQFRDTPGDLYVMNADGSDVTPLGELSAPLDWASRPAWSPDGRHIAFHRGSSAATSGIFVVLANGLEESRVPEIDDPWFAPLLRGPVWSPSGFVLVAHSESDGLLYRMNAFGGDVRELSQQSGVGRGASWRAANPELVYSCGTGGGGSICTIAADGSGNTLLKATGDNFDPDWSPDGDRILFARRASPDSTGIWIMDADGSNEQLVFQAEASRPSWSPDASAFVATVAQTNGMDIFVVDLASGAATNLTNAGTFDWDAAWRR